VAMSEGGPIAGAGSFRATLTKVVGSVREESWILLAGPCPSPRSLRTASQGGTRPRSHQSGTTHQLDARELKEGAVFPARSSASGSAWGETR
jgi:hypothetical protein